MMEVILTRRCFFMISTALVSNVTLAASAQSAQPADPVAQVAAGPDDRVPEIVVTAQKREQNLQNVPIAVTALTQETLQANRVTNVNDLSGLAPNLVVRPATGGSSIPSFSMRGIQSIGATPGADKEVSIYLDGVYISSARGSTFELPDIERIEVLRGPQGTLFGRNATAGAISIVTRNPTGKFGVRQEFTLGNYDQFRTRTTVDLPAWGPLSAYVTYVHDKRRGDIRNLGAGTTWDRSAPNSKMGVQSSPKWLGNKDLDSWFAAVRFEPSDAFRMTYKFDHAVNRTANGQAVIGVIPGGQPLLDAILATQPPGGGPNGPIVFDPSAKRPKAVNNAWTQDGFQRNSGHSLTSEVVFTDNLTLKNIAAYRETFLTQASQIDGLGGLVITPATAALVPSLAPLVGSRFLAVVTNAQSLSTQWSDETQLNYSSGLLTATAGFLYFHSEDHSGGPPDIRGNFNFAFLPSTGRVPLGNVSQTYNETTSLAAYTQAEIHVTPEVDVVGGLRVTNDKKSGNFVSGGTFVPGPNGIEDGTLSGKSRISFKYNETKPTYSLGVNYQPNRDILAYGKFSTGFVSGGAIGSVSFKPETVRSWEAGVKADLLGRRLRTNLALFHASYNNLQSPQSGRNVGHPELATVIIPLGKVKAYGFEFEGTAVPVDGLTFGASLGYTNVKFGPVNPILLASVGNGSYLPTLIPTWTSNLSAQYETRPLLGDARVLLRVDANWRSKIRMEANPQRTDGTVLEVLNFSQASWVINARAALRDFKIGPAETEIAIWARNLNNNKEMVYPLNAGFLASATFQPARTFGVDLMVKF